MLILLMSNATHSLYLSKQGKEEELLESKNYDINIFRMNLLQMHMTLESRRGTNENLSLIQKINFFFLKKGYTSRWIGHLISSAPRPINLTPSFICFPMAPVSYFSPKYNINFDFTKKISLILQFQKVPLRFSL